MFSVLVSLIDNINNSAIFLVGSSLKELLFAVTRLLYRGQICSYKCFINTFSGNKIYVQVVFVHLLLVYSVF